MASSSYGKICKQGLPAETSSAQLGQRGGGSIFWLTQGSYNLRTTRVPVRWATKSSQGWEKEWRGSLGRFGCQLDGKCEILLLSLSQLEGTHHGHNSSRLCPFHTNPIPRHFGAAHNIPWQCCWSPGISISSLGRQVLRWGQTALLDFQKARSLTAFSSQSVPKDTNPTPAGMTKPFLLPPHCLYTGIWCQLHS